MTEMEGDNTWEDEEIQKAIRASLLESEKNTSKREIINVENSDDEYKTEEEGDTQFEDDIRRAIEVSKLMQPKQDTSSSSTPIAPSTSTQPAAPVSAFLAERAELERSRLERQKRRLEASAADDEKEQPPRQAQKRMAGTSPSEVLKTDTETESESDEDEMKTQSIKSRKIEKGKEKAIVNGKGKEKVDEIPLFWDGALRQTANKHVDPKKDTKPTFRLSEIITSSKDMSFAILSSYAISTSFIYSFFDPRTPVILIGQPDEDGNRSVKNILPNWVKTTPFMRNGRGAMHVKLMLLFYRDGRLRIVIPTANFVDYDWRDIENSVWMQDIPPRPQAIGHDPKATDFPSTLQRLLHTLNVTAALKTHLKTDHPNLPIQTIDDLRTRWDWSKVQVGLVSSIAAKHEGWPDCIRTGHTGLMKAIRDIGARAGNEQDVIIECQGSSVGTYTTQWLNEFHTSARGDSAEEWLDKAKSSRQSLPFPPIKIVFPTMRTVKRSALGVGGGGTIFCQTKQWEGSKFPKGLFYDSRSKRGRVLMHSKMILATFVDKEVISFNPRNGKQKAAKEIDEMTRKINKDFVGWIYVGSHNFTPSAWGNLSGSSFTPFLNITNFELGIIFPLKTKEEADDLACWERPPKKYDLKTDRPWIQDEGMATLEDFQ